MGVGLWVGVSCGDCGRERGSVEEVGCCGYYMQEGGYIGVSGVRVAVDLRGVVCGIARQVWSLVSSRKVELAITSLQEGHDAHPVAVMSMGVPA